MKKFFVIQILFLFSLNFTFSQKAPIKFGKLDIEDLKMTVYEPDTSAAAVILCDYGYFNASVHEFTRLIRIKILKKEGLGWADKVFPTSSKSDIRGITYNLENGEIIEEKLKPSSIFEERVYEDYYRMRVAMPNVKVGSVIDMEFRYFFPNEWNFQAVIPVKWSELVLETSPYIRFQKNSFGYIPFHITSSNRWVTKDVPAFKKEPYMNSINNYISKFEFDILDVSIPGRYYQTYTTSWEAVIRLLNESDYYGLALKGSLFLGDVANEIKEKYMTPEEKLKAAFESVKKIKWNEAERLFASSTSMGYVYKKQIGNSTDINFILIQLLKKLGLEADPVILSTRENGVLSPIYPSLNKLNYTIARVKLNDEYILIDATEQYLPYYLIPERCINWQGRVIQDDSKSNWINLATSYKSKEIVGYEVSLSDDMALSGKISKEYGDYAAFNFRKDYKTYNSEEEYQEDLANEYPGLTIINSQINDVDDIYLSIKEKYDVKIMNQVNEIENEIYIIPMLYEQMKENPFKNDNRIYPIDFAYASEKMFLMKFTLPQGYKVTKLPTPANMKLPDNGGKFLYSANLVGNSIVVTCKITIDKPVFLPTEYPLLKEFFTQIVKKHAEPVIITKE